jgi:hypothetical protein
VVKHGIAASMFGGAIVLVVAGARGLGAQRDRRMAMLRAMPGRGWAAMEPVFAYLRLQLIVERWGPGEGGEPMGVCGAHLVLAAPGEARQGLEHVVPNALLDGAGG